MSGKVKYMALMAAAMMSEGMDAYYVDEQRRPTKTRHKRTKVLTAKQTKARRKSTAAKKARRKNRK